MYLVLIILLILLLVGSLPVYPYSLGWGPYPSGAAFVLLVILVVVLLTRAR